MVDKKIRNLQCLLLDSASHSSAETDRFIQKGMGWSMSRDINRRGGGRWLNEEQLLHIKSLELKAVKLALLAFNKQKTLTAVHFQIDNTNALLYLVKNGRNREPNVAEIKRRNLAVSLETPDHNYWRIPSNFLNVEADWQSRNSREASEWKL